MIKDYIDILIEFIFAFFMLFSNKEKLARVFHKSELSPSIMKLIRLGGVIILLGTVATLVSRFI